MRNDTIETAMSKKENIMVKMRNDTIETAMSKKENIIKQAIEDGAEWICFRTIYKPIIIHQAFKGKIDNIEEWEEILNLKEGKKLKESSQTIFPDIDKLGIDNPRGTRK